ncbi:hypothetical protein MIR68_011495 [Amoeboaphelidium protococcarum]|nr:hypothetical protein MIR68_011495 [Amoeboaphelidium protococcarum]
MDQQQTAQNTRGGRGRGGYRGRPYNRGGRGGSNSGGGKPQAPGHKIDASSAKISAPNEKKNALDFKRYLGRRVLVKCQGDIDIEGVLVGFDSLVNIALSEAQWRQSDDSTRALESVVCRNVLLVLPLANYQQIENPFLESEEADLSGDMEE